MKLFIGIVAALVFFLQASGARSDVIVPSGAEWQWLHPTDGVDPAKSDADFHTTFYKADFDDSAWKKGRDKKGPRGGFGYGEEEFEGVDLGQPEEFSNRKAAYLRLKFSTKESFDKIVFKCQRDDGIIVYLDGKEVVRDNVGKGKEAYDLFAVRTISGSFETKVNSYSLKDGLSAGDHILVVSVHNRSGESSDMRIGEISLEADLSATPLVRKTPTIDPDLFTFTVADGSTIVAKLDVTEIQLTTSYGVLTIPVRKILGFTPGLDSRQSLDNRIKRLLEKVGSLEYNEREMAKRELLNLGVAVRDEIRSLLATEKNARRIRALKAILDKIEEQAAESEEESSQSQIGLVRPDTVVTSRFTARGRISPQEFTVQCKFGQLTVRLSDIQKANRPFQRAGEITKSVTVSGQYIIQKKQLNTHVSIRRGDRVSIRATGQITMSPWGSNRRSTPDGSASQFGTYMTGIPTGALVGKIGTDGQPFKIGSKHTFTAKRSGILYLAIGMSSGQVSGNFPGQYKAKIRLNRD